MSTPVDPVTTITGALGTTQDDLMNVAKYGIGIGAAVLVVRKGYKLVRGFF